MKLCKNICIYKKFVVSLHKFSKLNFDTMPRRVIEKVQLPDKQPACCAECPLCGIIPKSERPKGSKETHVCLGTLHAISGRGTKSTSHRHKRPCDRLWECWRTFPNLKIGVPRDLFLKYRVPLEYKTPFPVNIIFHNE